MSKVECSCRSWDECDHYPMFPKPSKELTDLIRRQIADREKERNDESQ